ncbi:uncharacterized protein RHOBADRAFT_56093 [Rhodotorula graminis WP1]|uniref:Xylanolytic transcriptional activator regulatory domain-containing protein n=1 Tax=Rhodotorula graminis (strain WP1) TaxID=578459 RepID=A0A0P9EKR4_RHOGW|nr:uncharacterized protein RHOBADRAFT_56093 [Rhodotorula graminis WP1]KPV72281.1 hypothetical protein RHOBADRAFT_56093 [Rhodotorula graminis WP1]
MPPDRDGARPVCARCAKSARAHGEDPSTFVCVYDSGVPKAKQATSPTSTKDSDAIADLAAQIAELKEQLTQQRPPPPQQQQPEPDHSPQPFASTSSHTLDVNPPQPTWSASTPNFSSSTASANYYPAATATTADHTSTSLVWSSTLTAPYSSSTTTGPDLTDLAMAASPLYQLPLPTINWGALTHSSYPSDLPSPGLFARLVDVYFAKPHLATGLINERRFRQSLTYLELPSDPRSPSPCLLHALVATAALLVPESFYAPHEPRYWSPKSSLSSHHAKLAERALDPAFQRGRQLLQVVQASVLCCFCAYTDARFGDTWLVSAMAARLAVTVGLNHVRRAPVGAASPDAGGERGGPGGAPARTEEAHRRQRRLKDKSMLAPTSDREEVDERASVFFFCYAADKMTSAATGWAAAINEDDVTSLLPHPPGSEDTYEDPLSSPLYLHNPAFFTACPPHLTGALQLYFKAYILLGRVVRFLQRAPEPVGSGYAREDDPDLRETPAFRSLERTISHFRLSIPREQSYAYYASHAGIENTPFLVFTILHVLTILLHEPFCLAPDVDEQDLSFQKCAAAAKAIVASVYELNGSSFEVGLLASFLNYLWAVAGRTLVRALALASRRGDLTAAAQLANDVKALIGAMQANKSRVGAITALNLQRLLLHPFQVLAECVSGPSHDPSQHPTSSSSSSSSLPTPGATATSGRPTTMGRSRADSIDEAGHPVDEHYVPLHERQPGMGRYNEDEGALEIDLEANRPGGLDTSASASALKVASGTAWELLGLGTGLSSEANALMGMLDACGGQESGLWDLAALGGGQ